MAEFVLGSVPLWQHFSVADIFADAFLNPEARYKERPAKPFHLLAGSIQVITEALSRLIRDRSLESSPETGRLVLVIQKALSESMQIGSRLPIGKIEDLEEKSEAFEQRLAGKYLEFLNALVMKVNTMRQGDLLMLPGGWRTSEKEGHALMYTLLRDADSFTFAISNTGTGLDYHFARSEVNPPKLKKAMSLTFEKIPVQRLADSSFWFMLFRPMVYPHESNNAAYIYEILLPYLNQRPLSGNAVKQTGPVESQEWKVPLHAPVKQGNPENPFGAPGMKAGMIGAPGQGGGNPFGMDSAPSDASPFEMAPSMPAPVIDATQLLGLESMLKPVASPTPLAQPQPAIAATFVSPPAPTAPTNPLFAGLEGGSIRIEMKKAAPSVPAGKPSAGSAVAPSKPLSAPPLPAATKPSPPKAPTATTAKVQQPASANATGDLLDWDDFGGAPGTSGSAPPPSDPFGGLDPFAGLGTKPSADAFKKQQQKGPQGASGPPGETLVASEEEVTCEFRTVPRGGDASYARCVLESVHCGVRVQGGSREQSKTVSMLLRYSLVKMMLSDLMVASKTDLDFPDRQLVDRAIRNLSHAAEKEANFSPSIAGVSSTQQLFEIKRTTNELKKRLLALEPVSDMDRLPPELDLGSLPAQAATHPLFGRFRVDGPSVEQLAGDSTRPPIYRPVQLTLVPDQVETFEDVSTALRHACALCTRLAHQQGLIKNTYLLRVALVQHMFTRVIPLPLPLDHPSRAAQCFWGKDTRTMRRETQVDMMRSLAQVAQHFAAASLSLRVTRSLDAARILTMACIAAVSDAVMRITANDVPSPLASLYAGDTKAYDCVKAFGIEMRQFAAESAYFTLTDPNLALVRTQVLDYFMRQRRLLQEDHILFKWEQSMDCGPAEELLIDELSLAVGYPRPADAYANAMLPGANKQFATIGLTTAARMLSGELPEMLQDFPELGCFRDVVMILKVMMAPTADALPAAKAWMPADALLHWKVIFVKPDDKATQEAGTVAVEGEEVPPPPKKGGMFSMFSASSWGPAKKTPANAQAVSEWLVKKPPTSKFVVVGFRDTELKPTWGEVQGTGKAWYSSLFTSIASLFLSKKEPRVAPSMANPSFLLGAPVTTEDDVLHVKHMPDFGGRLSARNVELLAQYLTVPYLRIPLVLRFFSAQEMTSALAQPELMELVDGVVFEPGEWQADEEKVIPVMVPALEREHLATPLGLLFNELRFAPEAILDSVEKMILNVLELDTGRYSSSSSPAAFYVVRLCLRIYGYILTLLRHVDWIHDKSTTTSGGGSHVRGLECPPLLANKLKETVMRWRAMLLGRVLPMMTGWLRHCDEAGDMDLVCIIRAHLAYLFKETDWHKDSAAPGGDDSSSKDIVSVAGLAARTLLTSQLFITASYRVVTEPKAPSRFDDPNAPKVMISDADIQRAQARLGLDELEMFSLFQRHRYGLLHWLKQHPKSTNDIMEHAVSVLVNDSERRRKQMLAKARMNALDQDDEDLLSLDQEDDPFTAAAKKGTTYEARTWLSMSGLDCDGRFVPDTELDDNQKRLVMEKTKPSDLEEWLRLGGHNRFVDTELNVQLGEFTLKKHRVEPVDQMMCDFSDFSDIFGARVARTGGVHSAEVKNTKMRSWVRLVGQRHDLQLWALDPRTPSTSFTRVYPAKLASHERWIYEACDPVLKLCDPSRIEVFLENTTSHDADVARLACRIRSPTPLDDVFLESIKEIIVIKRLNAKSELQIFDVVEWGRKLYSLLVYSSNHAMALQQCATGNEHVAVAFLSRAILPTPSLVITRNLSKSTGLQSYIPDRFLYGLLPEALIEEYVFWQQENGDLTGYQRSAFSKGGASKSLYQIKVELIHDGAADGTGCGCASAAAVITRIPLLSTAHSRAGYMKMEDEDAPLLGIGAGDVIDPHGQKHVLLNLATNGSKIAVKRLCDLLLRLDCMSHVLAWARADDSEKALDLVELPRLGLSFKVDRPAESAKDRKRTLMCVDHPGLFVTNEQRRCPRTQNILKGLPHGVVLERDTDGALFVLLPASAKPVCIGHLGPGRFDAFELNLERADATWLANLKDERSTNASHYLYPIHASRSFLFTQTFASALYLLLLRLITGRYDEAFRLTDFCVTDRPLTPEEKQLVDAVVESQQSATQIADAVAVRLKMMIITAGTPMAKELPWNVAMELNRYLTSLTHVSGSCRLSREEELLLLELNATPAGEFEEDENASSSLMGASAILINRLTFLAKLDNQFKQAPSEPFNVSLNPGYMEKTDVYEFDSVVDLSATSVDDAFLQRMSVLSYSKPEDVKCNGIPAAVSMATWVRPGRMRLRGGKDSLGFLFLYELMTEQIPFKVLPGDSPFNWGALLLRHLPKDDTGHSDVLSSMLRLMSRNPYMAVALPKFVDQRRFKISTIFRGNNSLQQLLIQFREFVQKNPESVRVPLPFKRYEAPFQMQIVAPDILLGVGGNRTLVAPRVPDNTRSESELSPVQVQGLKVSLDDLKAFASAPLAFPEGVKLNDFVDLSRQGQQDLPTKVPFDVSAHPFAKSSVARDILSRLDEDVKWYADEEKRDVKPHLLGFSLGELSSKEGQERARVKLAALRTSLFALRERDDRFVGSGIDALLRLVNSVDTNEPAPTASEAQKHAFRKRLGLVFARDHGSEPTMWLTLLVGTALSSKGFAELRRLNPFLTEEDVMRTQDLVTALMLTINRASLVARCRVTASSLMDLLDKLERPSSSEQDRSRILSETALRADQLAELLSTQRYYMSMTSDKVKYDPRLLVFEFMQDIVLRKAQVELVGEFKQALEKNESRCHQMLMGGGKTTVIAPILALLLGAKDQLVVQVVPRALFDFSVKIMRASFSAVLQKHVYTFDYDRWTAPSTSLLQKLVKAKTSRGVVVTTPTAIKSFTLKFVETCNAIVELKAAIAAGTVDQAKLGFMNLLGRRFSRQARLQENQAKVNKQALDGLQHQAELCVRMLALFRSGTVLLDEVDLILHPLKSELNWPMGSKYPLDFCEGGSRRGLRWQAPFHLLEAIFCACDPKLAVKHEASRESQAILRRLRKLVDEGCNTKALQRMPHLVLVSRQFYMTSMLPLLARWAMVMLTGFGLSGISNEHLLQYLEKGTFPTKEIKAQVVRGLTDEQFKLVNLAHDWLHSFLPHVLSKVDRVSYGLLNEVDLEKFLKLDPNMPKSRKLLAIPFVGKDVPSRSSEFAHPDVVIGLTIMAYRYEGLRWKDFERVLMELKERMSGESGAYEKRPSCMLYERWVRFAGGRVRGRGTILQSAIFGALERAASSQTVDSFEDPDEKKAEEDARRKQEAEFVRRAVYMEGLRTDQDLFQDIWPLQFVDLRDEEQMGVLYRLLRKLPHVVEFFLDEMVFPETTPHQGLKLSTCGQALGGELLFRQRLGFSGTPSDMLPVELGKCRYEKGSDAKMMFLLTSPQVVSHQVLPSNWTVRGVLESVAKGNYHALLDTGALITGMSNLEVASALLRLGLDGMAGVVFLDDDDRKMILLRSGMRVMELSQSGVPTHLRFSFYDQIHTTGMDIHQALNAKAVLTLGKDMVFRDYAQGAFRMRGIGKGQTIHLYIVPEVLSVAEEMLALCGNGCKNEREALKKRKLASHKLASSSSSTSKQQALIGDDLLGQAESSPASSTALSPQQEKEAMDFIADLATQPPPAVPLQETSMSPEEISVLLNVGSDPALLRGVCAWLVINTMRAERMQFNLLCEQSVQNVWRKRAFWTLLRSFADGQTRVELIDAFAEMSQDLEGDRPLPLDASVEVFRERVDYTLANAVPERIALHDKLGRMIRTHDQFLVGPNDAMRVSAIQRLVIDKVDVDEEESDKTAMGKEMRDEVENADFSRENVQENEQEQEQEQHAEQEQEQEQEQQVEIEHESFAGIRYERETFIQPWNFNLLADPKSKVFYGASEFTCYGVDRVRPKTLNFPPYLLMSPNFHKHQWNQSNAHRRLKNVIVVLEWVPNLAKMMEIKDEVEEATLAAQAAAMAAAAAQQAAGNKKGSAGSAAAAAKAALAAVSQSKSNLGVLTPDQERILQHAFDLHATDALNHDQIREVLATLGTDVETAEEMQEVMEAAGKPGSFFADFDMLKRIVLTRPLETFQAGRFYVMISLLEAETLRGILHARADVFDNEVRHRDFVDNANTAIAIRLADFNLREDKSTNMSTNAAQQLAAGGARLLSPLEQTGKFISAKRFQDLTAAQCLRFIDSELYYQERELNAVIQALRLNTCDERRLWFKEIRSCRRRNQAMNFDATPVARVFTEPDQYRFLAHRATVARVRGCIQNKRMYLLDAFRAFDTDRDGRVGCSELFAGLEWLGMKLTAMQVQDFMREVSPVTGYLNYEEFKTVFMDKSLRDADPLLGGGPQKPTSTDPFGTEEAEDDEDDKVIYSEVVIVPKKIEELSEIGREDKSEKQKQEEETKIVKVLQNVAFRVVPHAYFASIWNTRTFKGAANKCGLWKAELDLGWYSRRRRELLPFGNYGVNGYQALSESNGFKVIELSGARAHASIRDRLLPVPKRFSLVFSKTQGSQLYIWAPIPPSDKFVALGHVATTTSKEPPLDSARCVPIDWVNKWTGVPTLVWTDVGTAGRPGSIWQVGGLGCIWAATGHDSPRGPFYELKANHWLVSSEWQMVPQGQDKEQAAIKDALSFSKRASAEE